MAHNQNYQSKNKKDLDYRKEELKKKLFKLHQEGQKTDRLLSSSRNLLSSSQLPEQMPLSPKRDLKPDLFSFMINKSQSRLARLQSTEKAELARHKTELLRLEQQAKVQEKEERKYSRLRVIGGLFIVLISLMAMVSLVPIPGFNSDSASFSQILFGSGVFNFSDELGGLGSQISSAAVLNVSQSQPGEPSGEFPGELIQEEKNLSLNEKIITISSPVSYKNIKNITIHTA